MSEIPARDKLKPALKLLFWIILIAALIAVEYFNVQGLLKSTLNWIAGLGPWGPVTLLSSIFWLRFSSFLVL